MCQKMTLACSLAMIRIWLSTSHGTDTDNNISLKIMTFHTVYTLSENNIE